MSAAKENPCRKFQANIFNKSKCQNCCFKPRESHLLNDKDLTQVTFPPLPEREQGSSFRIPARWCDPGVAVPLQKNPRDGKHCSEVPRLAVFHGA
uniref:Uncharacterized protein n=1 Tax=Equus asinus TaxID=9793 RepID=A0A9L0K9W5_EQUAS